MPGIDFNRLRADITLAQVLDLLAFEPVARSGAQCYGRCPLHEAPAKSKRFFSVNLALGRYYCHRCHSHGNALELWAAPPSSHCIRPPSISADDSDARFPG